MRPELHCEHDQSGIATWRVRGKPFDHRTFVANATAQVARRVIGSVTTHTFCPIDGCTLLLLDPDCPACLIRWRRSVQP